MNNRTESVTVSCDCMCQLKCQKTAMSQISDLTIQLDSFSCVVFYEGEALFL